ncbi:MAG: histidinol-phosphate transaminase [Planctomycetes bacterium]|nr:histidinol-phosphate transaminase [Planctomycetota bacterium]
MTPSLEQALSNIRSGVRRLKGYQVLPHGAKAKLNQNECPFDYPEELKRAVLDAFSKRAWQRYPTHDADELARRLSTLTGHPREGLIVGNGSNELLLTLFHAIVHPGTRVVYPAPSFSLFRVFSEAFEADARPIPLSRDLEYDIPAFEKAVSHPETRLVIIDTPNNPTGAAIAHADIRRVCESTRGLVLVDEAYFQFQQDTALPLVRDYPHLLILRTFSKALQSAGLRIGYLLGRPEVVAEIAKVKLPYSVGTFAQVAALNVLEHPEWTEKNVLYIVAERDRMAAEMGGMDGVKVYRSRANFLLFRVRDSKAAFDGLLKGGVLVRDVSGFPLLENCLRVSVGTRDENDLFLKVLRAVSGRPRRRRRAPIRAR